MRVNVTALGRLQKLAKLKSDIEMRRFAAFRVHVDATRARIADHEQALQDLYAAPPVESIAESRLVIGLVNEAAQNLAREEGQFRRILPGFEAARQAAAREFGRAEVVGLLQDRAIVDNLKTARRNEGG